METLIKNEVYKMLFEITILILVATFLLCLIYLYVNVSIKLIKNIEVSTIFVIRDKTKDEKYRLKSIKIIRYEKVKID